MIDFLKKLVKHQHDEPQQTERHPVRNVGVDLERERIARLRLEYSLSKAEEVRENWMAREIRLAKET